MSASTVNPLAGQTRPRHRLRGAGVLAAVFIAVSCCAAACGGGSGTAPSASQGAGNAEKGVAYADCMRAHGVTNYPDPGSENSSTGIDMNSATFESARAKCASLMPFGHISTHATEQQITQALASATCIRDHGFPAFPDPIVTSTYTPASEGAAPSAGGGTGGTTSYSNGILFKVPSSIDTSSAAFQAAAKACNSPLYVPGGASPQDGAPS
jgi:hypothetical protein